jgi:hypothetical protein
MTSELRSIFEGLTVARKRGDLEAIVAGMDSLVAAYPDSVVYRLRRERALVRFGQGQTFEAVLDRAIASLQSGVPDLETFREALWAIHFSAFGQNRVGRLEQLLAAITPALVSDSAAPWEVIAAAQALLSLRRRSEFTSVSERLTGVAVSAREQRSATRIQAVARRWDAPSTRHFLAPKVFVIGLSRTGTTSTHAALERLGFLGIHWMNELTFDLIQPEDLPIYDAFSDIGISMQFEALHAQYPNARFIWTRRPIAAWGRSVRTHYQKHIGVERPEQLLDPSVALIYGGLKARIHAAVYAHYPDWESAYRAHERRITSFFDPTRRDRLLEFNVTSGDGWASLCSFLDKPTPVEVFPNLNRTHPDTRRQTDELHATVEAS